MPESNPILEELHRVRDSLAKASDNDPHKIAEAARARHRESGRQAVRLPPRRTGSAKLRLPNA